MPTTHLDERALAQRVSYFEITDDDLARLGSLRSVAEGWSDGIVEGFYDLLLGHPDTRKFFPDEATVRRVKRTQRDYFLGLFSGRLDKAYVEDRMRVGAAHERIGLGPTWYLGAYRRFMALLSDRVCAHFADRKEAEATIQSARKLVFFDISIAVDSYIVANIDALRRHQAAIRELSTPVIRVLDGVLLLPLIGTIDSQRAQQVMEAVLVRVSEDRARVLIVDIAGVPVVDTKVADHLLKTTAAVRLLGADTVLTGISAQVARTIVQLGVDISSMHTRSRLADGIDLALAMVGKRVCPIPTGGR